LILHKLSDQLTRSPDGRPLTVTHIKAVQVRYLICSAFDYGFREE